MELTAGNGARESESISSISPYPATGLYLVLAAETLTFAGLISSGKIGAVVLTLFRALLTL